MSAQIVVCEGEPYLSRMIACRLMRADFAVHSSRDCETAGDIIERLRPQLLIVDLQYPAVELLCRVRGDEAFADLPIIGLTSVAGHPAAMALMQQQLNLFAVLTKPFSLRRLVHLARKAVQQSAELLSVV
jgi:two-component system, OmpR family, alkaline phosphatase synthesis response regulator PhoP